MLYIYIYSIYFIFILQCIHILFISYLYHVNIIYYVSSSFGNVVVVVSDPSLLKYILLNNHLFDKDIIHYRLLGGAIGNGIPSFPPPSPPSLSTSLPLFSPLN